MEAHDWIAFSGLALALVSGLIAVVRYLDTQVVGIVKTLSDKLSIGEYNRRHEDLEKRIRALERWQDHANGRYKHEYFKDDP